MKHYPIGVHKYIPKQFLLDVAIAKKPYHMIGSGTIANKKDVGSMKSISGEGMQEVVKHSRTIAPLRFIV